MCTFKYYYFNYFFQKCHLLLFFYPFYTRYDQYKIVNPCKFQSSLDDLQIHMTHICELVITDQSPGSTFTYNASQISIDGSNIQVEIIELPIIHVHSSVNQAELSFKCAFLALIKEDMFKIAPIFIKKQECRGIISLLGSNQEMFLNHIYYPFNSFGCFSNIDWFPCNIFCQESGTFSR